MWWLQGAQSITCSCVCSSVSSSINDFAVLRVVSHPFFLSSFLFVSAIFALKYIFPEAPHIRLWVSAVSSVRGLWGPLNPLCQLGSSPSNLFPQRPVLLFLIVNTRPLPSHKVSYLPRYCYHQQAALYAGYRPPCFTLYVILPLCLNWSLCQERQVQGIK